MTGRKAFQVTAALRQDVESMKADGFSDERIAAQLGISRTTLLKHFARELEFGADKVRREMLANLRRMSRKNVAAAKALLARPTAAAPGPTPLDEAQPAPALGKKEIANRDAQTAEVGTSWSGILKH